LVDFSELEEFEKTFEKTKNQINNETKLAITNFIETSLFDVTERSILIKSQSDIELLKKY